MEAFIAVVAGLVMCVAIMFFFLLICKEFSAIEMRPNIRVVKRGKIPTEKVECPYCHSIIEYTKRNVWYGGKSIDGKMLRHYVDCPVCHENILVREEKGGEE